MKRHTVLQKAVVLFLGGLLILPAAAQAFPFGGRGPCHFFGGCFRVLSGENELSDDQKEQLRTLRDETRDKIVIIEEEIAALKIPETLLAEQIDEAAASALLEQFTSLQNEIAKIVSAADLEKAMILTPAQRQIILECVENRPSPSEQGWKAGRRGSPPCLWPKETLR